MLVEPDIVRRLYKRLLRFYPRAFRKQLVESMEQTFNDLFREKRQTNKGLFVFILWTFIETTIGIFHEYLLLATQGNSIKNIITSPTSAALAGLLFIAPFAFLNAIVGNRIEPFFSFIRPGAHTSPLEYVLLAIVLFLLPFGAFIAARPVFQKGIDGKRKFYIINILLAAILIMGFVAISFGLGSDIYRCDVLQIPNCD